MPARRFLLLVVSLLIASVPASAQSPTYLGKWGPPGSSPGQFQSILGLAIDSSNNVYVADPQDLAIKKFTAAGEYLTQWRVGESP